MNDVIKKNGVLFGTILAAYYTLTTAFMFFIDKELFVNIPFGFISIFVSLTLAVLAVLYGKKKLGGYITFKNAFTSYFLTIVMGLLAYTLVNFILFNLIDPSAKVIFTDLSIAFTEKNMSGLHVDTETINATIEQIRTTDNFTLGNLVKAFAWKTLLYCVGGMLVALIFRNQSEA